MKVFSRCDIGKVRESNQDYCRTGLFPNGDAWAVVCDGVGGANGGDIASRMACEKISEYIVSDFSENNTDEEIRELIFNAVSQANDFIYQMSVDNINLRGMCTTVVTAIVRKEKFYIVHAGDSRAYLLGPDNICQLTKDHTVIQELIDSGEITPQQAQTHPAQSYITRALGVEDNIRLDYISQPFSSDSCIVICTDGLTKFVSDSDILNFSKNYTDDTFVENLVQSANDSGGSDNITVALVCH